MAPSPRSALKIKRNARSLLCVICNKVFTSNGTYLKHIKRHLVANKFQCPQCQQLYFPMSRLHRHIQQKHTKEGNRQFHCRVCSKRFPLKYQLLAHLRRPNVHIENRSQSTTNKSGLIKSAPAVEKSIVKTDIGRNIDTEMELPFQCYVKSCKKIFSNRSNLRRHLYRIHKIDRSVTRGMVFTPTGICLNNPVDAGEINETATESNCHRMTTLKEGNAQENCSATIGEPGSNLQKLNKSDSMDWLDKINESVQVKLLKILRKHEEELPESLPFSMAIFGYENKYFEEKIKNERQDRQLVREKMEQLVLTAPRFIPEGLHRMMREWERQPIKNDEEEILNLADKGLLVKSSDIPKKMLDEYDNIIDFRAEDCLQYYDPEVEDGAVFYRCKICLEATPLKRMLPYHIKAFHARRPKYVSDSTAINHVEAE